MTIRLAAGIGAAAACVWGQSTQSVISGGVVDGASGRPLAGASVSYSNPASGAIGVTLANALGYYVLAFLSPGFYRVRVEAAGHQAQEIHEIEVPVAARIDLGFRLRPLSDVWEAGLQRSLLVRKGALLTFFGPDVDTSRSGYFEVNRGRRGSLQNSLSYVIDPRDIGSLPLANRQVYTMILTLPGVTAAYASGRSLSMAANGQRSSSSNFMLDGVENNDTLISGPTAPAAPEAIQEYRVSTNNFSAEYGRTAGFVANAVTRSGSNELHGLLYGYFNDERLNANAFVRNAAAFDKLPKRQAQAGFSAGGPLRLERLFWSAAFERFRHRSRTGPQGFLVPLADRFASCAAIDPAGAAPWQPALDLLRRFPPPPANAPPLAVNQSPCSRLTAPFLTNRKVSVNQILGLARLDYSSPSGRDRIAVRFSLYRLNQPDFLFSLYQDFSAPLDRTAYSTAFSWVRTLGASTTNELIAGVRRTGLRFDRGAAGNFSLNVSDFLEPGYLFEVQTPGNGKAGVLYDLNRHENTIELGDNVLLARGRHLITVGGALLARRNDSFVNYLGEPIFHYSDPAAPNTSDIIRFGRGLTSFFQVSADRQALAAGRLSQPSYTRETANNQFYGFVQDNVKLGGRVVINLGLRYESFGSPRNTGAQDAYLQFPSSAASIGERVAGSTVAFDNDAPTAYRPDRNNWAGRVGFSVDLTGRAATVVRGAWGVFYDRPFDNLTFDARMNNLSAPLFCFNAACRSTAFDARRPVGELLGLQPAPLRANDSTESVWIDRGLRTPYVNSWFFSLQQRLPGDWTIEANYAGSASRKGIATDIVNRPCGGVACATALVRPNRGLNNVYYRSNGGGSHYQALSLTAQARLRRGQFRAAYTWSHTIDNQSDALAGGPFFLDLCFTNPAAPCPPAQLATFTR